MTAAPGWTRRLLFAAGPPVVAAGIGGLSARNAPATYGRLRKPHWAPPVGVFGPGWTVLYATIAAAGWHLYTRSDRATKALHLSQLAMNTVWPAVLFAQRRKPASVSLIVLLDGVLVAEIAALRRTDRTAAAMLVPYLAWSVFATALNAAVSEPAQGPPVSPRRIGVPGDRAHHSPYDVSGG